ncbi:MAG: FliI/YscN family ATPase [Treponema sp.]|jgi:flagellum-specific ATP synthase|nr:FliI/YscN family ATPase [Treponema sp.]
MRLDIFDKYIESTERTDPIKCIGTIIKVQGLLIESHGPQAIIGEICRIICPKGKGEIRAEVVGLYGEIVQLMPFDETDGIEIGDRVIALGSRLEVPVSEKLLGRVLDALGNPIDGKGSVACACLYPALTSPPDPLQRKLITERITTGVRAIDGLLAVGKGQRLGIFAGAGVGKSTLLGMIARNTSADVNVVALIGERGREVNDFIENVLGPKGMERSVVVATPSNSPPLARLRGAYVATAIAEFFRDQGKDVMLFFDSVTRFARAMREIGLASGEPAAQKGFPPSMFDSMPKLLERSGTSDKGSITGFYTVLVDGDDMDEPVTDTVRGILDGHIVLSRQLQHANHYPPIDVLHSISRLAPYVSGPTSREASGIIRKYMADYARVEDFINAGAYRSGSNPSVDVAITKHEPIEDFLIQAVDEPSCLEETLSLMSELTDVEIPDEEMIDKNAKIPFVSSRRVKEKPQEQEDPFNLEDTAMALNSVASLFSSLPGMNILEEV